MAIGSAEIGNMTLNENDARRRIQVLPRGNEPRIRWAGFDLPGEVAEGNLLTVGAAGTGKTRMHRELMRSVVESIGPGSDRRLLVYDAKCDLLSELRGMNPSADVLIFDPLDKRSVAWDVAADVQTPAEARDFADSFVPCGNKGEAGFFLGAARVIVAGVINSLTRTHPGNWNLRRLILIMANRRRLERVLSGSNLIDQFFSPPEIFEIICSTIANVMVRLEPVAALWEHADRKTGLNQWATSGGSILVLGAKGSELRTALQDVNRAALKTISRKLLSEPESPRRSRLWFFGDDFVTAGQFDCLRAMLDGRSKGIRCALCFQDLEGMTPAYGNAEHAREVSPSCATMSWLKLTSTETAEWASRCTGNVVPAAAFLHLPSFESGNVHGVHLIKGVGGVFESTAHHDFPKTNPADDFQPRPDSQFALNPWSDEDDKWLDAGQP
jgi:hypothetical protein